MSQTAYLATEPAGAQGMLAECGHVDGKDLPNSDAALVEFGKAVDLEAPDYDSFVPAAGGVFAGVTSCQFAQEDYDNVGVAVGEVNKVIRKGRIWVTVDSAVDPSTAVFIVNATGNFGSAGDTDISANASWCSTAGVGELAILEINLP